MIKTVFLAFLLTLIHLNCWAQYDLTVTPTQKNLESISYDGYITTFLETEEDVSKAFWKYCKKFASVTNNRTHRLIKIPSADKTLAPIILIEKTEGKTESSEIFLAVYDQTDNTFKKQVKKLLLDFKVDFYVDGIENQIVSSEEKLADLTSSYQSICLDEAKALKKGLEQDNSSLKKGLESQILDEKRNLNQLRRELTKVK